jgi:hypothetical protein
MTLSEVADLITSQRTVELAHGNYYNRRFVRGYYVQLKCADHWCKISISNVDQLIARISVRELDAVDPSALTLDEIIPLNSIATAVKWASDSTNLQPYNNSSMVPGVWTEFRYGNNWYMISVSHVDVPLRATPAQKDRIADEFLEQQGFGRDTLRLVSRNRAWR